MKKGNLASRKKLLKTVEDSKELKPSWWRIYGDVRRVRFKECECKVDEILKGEECF